MTREELLEKEIYCPEVFDDKIIIYLRLGFKVLFLFENIKGILSYYLLTFNPNYDEDFVKCFYKNYNKLHIIKDLDDIIGWPDNGIIDIFDTYHKTMFKSRNQIIEITINEIELLQQYINNFKYGHSD